MTTFVDLAETRYPEKYRGNSIHPLQGKSFTSQLKGKDEPIHKEPVFWEHEGNRAVRLGDYKLVMAWDDNQPENWELYNVRKDRTEMRDLSGSPIYLHYSHDDDFDLFINGMQVVETGYSWNYNVIEELPEEVKATFRKGENIITAYRHNRTGGAYVDFGLYEKEENKVSFQYTAQQKSVSVLHTQTIYKYANDTSSRVPVSDWHDMVTAERVNFKARSVVGGYFMKMLEGILNAKK